MSYTYTFVNKKGIIIRGGINNLDMKNEMIGIKTIDNSGKKWTGYIIFLA